MDEVSLRVLQELSSTAVLIYFLTLWHKRTMARDKQFKESMSEMQKATHDCINSFVEILARAISGELTPRD